MKKVISLFLVMAMLTAMLTVSFSALSLSDEGMISAKEAVAAYEEETGEEVETQRIYFQMPNGNRGGIANSDVSVHKEVTDPETGEILDEYDEVVIHAGDKAPSWYSEYSMVDGKYYAGIYWWDSGVADPTTWCGYRMEIEDYDQGIYYIDLPIDVVSFNINNGVDGGMDDSKPIYFEAAQTVDTNSEGADIGFYDTLPEGSPDPWTFDGCIYIVDPNSVSINPLSNKQTCGATWYVYYGNGCYGYYSTQSENFVSVEENCMNPDHNHGTVEPTTPEPTQPTNPYANLDLDSTKLYFDANSTGWTMAANDAIGFYAFPLSDSVSAAYKGWSGRRLQGSDKDGDGIWEYDPKNFKLEDGVQYKIIFAHAVNNAFTEQTYDLFFDTTCLGHVAYCDGTMIENPADSSKKTLAAYWDGKDTAEYGPVQQITSIGNVVGTCLEQGKTAADIFSDFVTIVNETTNKTGLDNARTYVVEVGTKTEQQLIDDIGTALELTKQEVYDIFTNNEIETDWDYKVSTLPGEVVVPHTHTPGEPVRENVKEATCKEEGSYDEVVYCSECGEELSRETKTIAKVDHTPGEAVQENVKEAACETEGSYDEVVYCTVCGEELSRETKTIEKAAHTLKFRPSRKATATADGWKSHFECTVCGKYFADANATREMTWEQVVVRYESPTEPKPIGLLGDVDGNGEIDIVDVTFIQRIDAGIKTADATMKKLGDVNGDGEVDIIDATLIQRWLVGLNDNYKIGENIF